MHYITQAKGGQNSTMDRAVGACPAGAVAAGPKFGQKQALGRRMAQSA